MSALISRPFKDAAGVQHLKAALAVLTRLGVTWEATRVRADRSTTTVCPRGNGKSPSSPLEGMTNRAIADSLHLSQRVVKHHVTRDTEAGTRSCRSFSPALRP